MRHCCHSCVRFRLVPGEADTVAMVSVSMRIISVMGRTTALMEVMKMSLYVILYAVKKNGNAKTSSKGK